MTFFYREITISGGTSGVEGSSKLIQEIKDTLVNNMGWTLTEDRSAQAGTNHKVILQTSGETAAPSTFYLVLTSGGTNNIGIQGATFWNTTLHTVGSGVASPAADTTCTLNTSENANFTAWISGNKDSVVLITKVTTSVDGVYCGRIKQLSNPAFDHFPYYIVGSTATSIDVVSDSSNSANTFLNATTALTSSEADFYSVYTDLLGTTTQPSNIYGATESYFAFPNFAVVNDTSPVRKSIRGFSMNFWSIAGPNVTNATFASEDEFTAADGRVYKIFFTNSSTTHSAVIRKS